MFIYVAGPYTKGDTVLNVREAVTIGNLLRLMGHTPFIPHLTFAWHLIIPQTYDFWCAYDMEWLEKCDAVFRFPGESTGADKEVERAKEIGLPVFYTLDDVKKYEKGT